MLNRRIIRGKVLQQIFAYKTCEVSHGELEIEKIIEKFSPDLNSNEPQDAKMLEGYAKLTLLHFNEFLKTGQTTNDDSLPAEVKAMLITTQRGYFDLNQKEKGYIMRKMVEDSEKLSIYFLQVLNLLVELADKIQEQKKNEKLNNNIILKHLKEDGVLNNEFRKQNINWVNDQDVVEEIQNALIRDSFFKEYNKSTEENIDFDRKALSTIIKNVLFKNASFNNFFETKQLLWQEDRAALKDMLVDAIKDYNPDQAFDLPPISKNWDDDKQFMQDLFLRTLKDEAEYERLISPKLINWDISRLTMTDIIIIKMCLCEMINFNNIPLKVSMNEYIELAKKYSTPKSKVLVNGVLDILCIELVENGKIKKSGRGLIDNK